MALAYENDRSNNQKHDNQSFKNPFPKRNRPFCTHCNVLGHTIERYFNLHGYPPGYIKYNKLKDANANQVQTADEGISTSEDNNATLPQLTTTQYRQLFNLLASQHFGMTHSDPNT